MVVLVVLVELGVVDSDGGIVMVGGDGLLCSESDSVVTIESSCCDVRASFCSSSGCCG